VYNYNRKTKEWCLVKSESGGLGCWDKSNHQDDEGKVSASGWTEEPVNIQAGDQVYITGIPGFEGVHTWGVDALSSDKSDAEVKKEQDDDQ
jgi:hypothetical protein